MDQAKLVDRTCMRSYDMTGTKITGLTEDLVRAAAALVAWASQALPLG